MEMKAKLNLHQIIKKFFEPLIKHKFLTISASFIISIAMFLFVDVGLAELVRQNSYSIHILASEMIIELGPDLTYESKIHAKMIKQYTEHLEQRQFASILRVLYPECSPKNALASVLSDLEKATNNEEAKKAIWQAGVASGKLCLRSNRFPRSPIKWFKYEDLPDWLEADLEEAFDTFHEQVDKLEKVQILDVNDAVTVYRDGCKSSRKALLLLSLARLGYKNGEKRIERYLDDLKQAHEKVLLFAGTEKFKSQQNLFSDSAFNMNLRIKIVEAMLDNDIDRACDFLREVIERAIERKIAQ
jgi:hypothetical protein